MATGPWFCENFPAKMLGGHVFLLKSCHLFPMKDGDQTKIIENSVPKQTKICFLYMEAGHVSLNHPIMRGRLYSM